MIFFKKIHTEKIRITIGNVSKKQSEKLRSNNINNFEEYFTLNDKMDELKTMAEEQFTYLL